MDIRLTNTLSQTVFNYVQNLILVITNLSHKYKNLEQKDMNEENLFLKVDDVNNPVS